MLRLWWPETAARTQGAIQIAVHVSFQRWVVGGMMTQRIESTANLLVS
jgi:hypothetical protein